MRSRRPLHWLVDEFSMQEPAAKISLAMAIIILITVVAFVTTLFSGG